MYILIQSFFQDILSVCILTIICKWVYFDTMHCMCRPQNLLVGMNKFLESLDITFRRDPNNFRPRINKLNSVKVRSLFLIFYIGGDLSSRVRASVFIVSIHNVAVVWAFEPRGGRYLLFAANVRCQWCFCVLSSPWWSRPSRTLIIHCILRLV